VFGPGTQFEEGDFYIPPLIQDVVCSIRTPDDLLLEGQGRNGSIVEIIPDPDLEMDEGL
jgi:hypothetical protein